MMNLFDKPARTWRDIDRERKAETRERIRQDKEARREAKADVMREERRIKAEWHVSNAQREIEYCGRMSARYEKRAADLEYKVTYYQSLGLPCAGLEQQLIKAQDDLFKHQERISKAEMELAIYQHRLDNIELF